MLRFLTAIAVLAVLTFASGAQATIITELPGSDVGQSAVRNALVIGNSAYTNISPLTNPSNDASAVATALSEVGFHVFRAIDVDRTSMIDVIGQFLNSVTPGSEALVYYAGHGVELDGQNYLLPTDIRKLDVSQQYSLRTDGVSLSMLLQDLEARKPRVSLVILDACRNNPFAREGTRSLGTTAGLGRVDPPQGTLVLYAAAAGEMALDSLGPQDKDTNGLFTRNFLKLIRQPGLEIRPMVQELKDRVYEAALNEAQHTQRPSYYDGLIGKFYFLPPKPEGTISDPCTLAVRRNLGRDELILAEPGAALAACSEALQRDPESALFRELLSIAEEQRAAQKALISDNPVYARAYLELYPNGSFAGDVRTHVASLDVPPVIPQPTPVPTPEVLPTPVPAVDPIVLARETQSELNRVGCGAGTPDGVWGRNSERALERFVKQRGIELASLEPSSGVLDQLKAATGTVCPVSCTATQQVQNGMCVAKTCPAGQKLSSKGACYTPQASAPTPKRSGGSNSGCFVFNGQTFCE